MHRLLRDFQNLSIGVRLVALGSFLAVIFTFFPWFEVNEVQVVGAGYKSISSWKNAFELLPIFGFLSLFFALFAFLGFLQHFSGHKKTFGFSHSAFWIFLGGQSLFTLSIALFVFWSISQGSTPLSLSDHITQEPQIRFGLLLSLMAHAAVTFGGYIVRKEDQEHYTRSALAPETSSLPGNMTSSISAEEPSISQEQLSFSEHHDR